MTLDGPPSMQLPVGRSIIIDMNHHAIYGKIHEISMVSFHSYVKLPEGRYDTITVIYLLVLWDWDDPQ